MSKPRLPRRVLLVVGNKGIGDAVEALPVFEMIRRHWPSVSLTAGSFRLTTQRVALSRSPYVDELVELHGSVSDPWKALPALRANARAMRGFSDVVFLYKHQALAWPVVVAARLAGARAHFQHGYASRGRRTTYSDFPEHVFFQIVASELLLGYPLARPLPLSWRVEPDEARFAQGFLSQHNVEQGTPLVMLNTRGLDTRNWGIERFARLASRLDEHGVRVIINGGSAEQVDEYRRVADQLPTSAVLLERPNVAQLTAVLARCDLLIGEPSGPTTFAMAVGTSTLSIQGPGEYEYPGQERIGPIWWPRGPQHEVLSGIEWCQLNVGEGCQCLRGRPTPPVRASLQRLGVWEPLKRTRKRLLKKLGRYKRKPRQRELYSCLESISVDRVVVTALRMLRSAETRPVLLRDAHGV